MTTATLALASLFLVAFRAPTPTQSGDALKALAERADVRRQTPQKRVMAFYYPWYGSLERSGVWAHWEQVDLARKDIRAATNYPKLGPYDSLDPSVIAQHCRWAREAGIDTLIVSWWGPNDRSNRALPLILSEAERQGLKVTAYFEEVRPPVSVTSALSDLRTLLQTHAGHSAWLREEGRPVVFVYGRAVGQLGLERWAETLSQLEKHAPAIVIGDSLAAGAARVFDGIHTYNTCAQLQGKSPTQIAEVVESLFRGPLETADRFGRVACATVIPGYDDTKIRKPGIRAERLAGQSYRSQWEAALRLNPDWVLVTSFNEWHEGSEIEPSIEHGDLYLRLTAEAAARFRRLPSRAKKSAADRERSAIEREARALLSRHTVGVLPEAASGAAAWFAGAAKSAKALSWERIAEGVSPEEFPLILYAGGERYTQSVRRPQDVDAGLRNYLDQGGCLIVAGSEPIPFYANERGETVNALAKFGLPLTAGGSGVPRGFESPPEGVEFRFRGAEGGQGAKLQEIPFPKEGDLRWRPLIASATRQGDKVTPILTLIDREDKCWGDGAAVVKLSSGGKIGYVWFRLMDGPAAESVLAAVALEAMAPKEGRAQTQEGSRRPRANGLCGVAPAPRRAAAARSASGAPPKPSRPAGATSPSDRAAG